MAATSSVWELLLEHEREKCARLESVSRKAESIITTLQEENARLQSEIDLLRHSDNAALLVELNALKTRVRELEGTDRLQERIAPSEETELAKSQREIIRLGLRLSACEKALQEAMDERETLILRLKKAQKSCLSSQLE